MNEFLKPPYTNGVMELTEKEKTDIKVILNKIVEEFVPSMEQVQIDTFYIVATYNTMKDVKIINGDTAEFLLNEVGE